jgi:hypothetical protein
LDKSVAHLPWRAMTYKTFTTFVDDIFAFMIEAPWSYRIATMRDDVIFFIFLYQRYLYRTDYTRANEFGYSYEIPAPEIDDDGPQIDQIDAPTPMRSQLSEELDTDNLPRKRKQESVEEPDKTDEPAERCAGESADPPSLKAKVS